MDWIYHFLDRALPFDWASLQFMKNAFLAVLFVAPTFGLLGTAIVSGKLAFFSDALGHSILTGIALGIIFGLRDPVLSIIGFSVFFAFTVLFVKNRMKDTADTVISVFSSTAAALGIVLLSRTGSFARYTSYLIGDFLSIRPVEILYLIIILIGCIVVWSFSYNSLLMANISPSLARSRKIPLKLPEIIFTALLALVVALSIQWVGLLVINALLVLPAAAARNFSRNILEYHLFSIIISVISGITGLILSYYIHSAATGATIVLVSFAFFALSFVFKWARFRQ